MFPRKTVVLQRFVFVLRRRFSRSVTVQIAEHPQRGTERRKVYTALSQFRASWRWVFISTGRVGRMLVSMIGTGPPKWHPRSCLVVSQLMCSGLYGVTWLDCSPTSRGIHTVDALHGSVSLGSHVIVARRARWYRAERRPPRRMETWNFGARLHILGSPHRSVATWGRDCLDSCGGAGRGAYWLCLFGLALFWSLAVEP